MKRLTAAGVLLLAAVGCSERGDPPAPRAAVSYGVPASRTVSVYFRRDDGCDVFPVERVVTGTRPLDFAWAAIEMLLEGPTEEEAAHGLQSAFPDRDRVWRYGQSRVAFGYDPPFPGEEVSILGIREEDDGVLFVDFSPEIEAYGGGPERLCALFRQLESTVEQFDEYRAVRIAVNGDSRGALQP